VKPITEAVPVTIRSGTFYGECSGYCRSETTINRTNILYLEWSQDQLKFPDRSKHLAITDQEWGDLVNSADMAALMKLDSVIGCPDCNDGGGEWVEVVSPEHVKRVVFERGKVIDSIKDLVARVRAVRERARL
jgi:hypothetical protein